MSDSNKSSTAPIADEQERGSSQNQGEEKLDSLAAQAASFDATMPDDEVLYDLADLFKVFADTTRIKILYSLMQGELCVADIAEEISVSQSAVSHQLRILKASRLVKFQRDGKNILYLLSDDHVYTVLAQGMTHICE